MKTCTCQGCRVKLREAHEMGLQWATLALEDLKREIERKPRKP